MPQSNLGSRPAWAVKLATELGRICDQWIRYDQRGLRDLDIARALASSGVGDAYDAVKLWHDEQVSSDAKGYARCECEICAVMIKAATSLGVTP